MSASASSRCHICGWDLDYPPWGEAGTDPTWNICACCGCEFGYEDATPESAGQYRRKWIAEGRRWFKPGARPESWDHETQLRLVPELPEGIARRGGTT